MASHLDEQQELENFKYLWNKWGRWVFAALVLAAAAYFGSVMYAHHRQEKNGEAAAALAALVEKAQGGSDEKAVRAELLNLQQNHPDSIAAAQAAMMAAADDFDKGRYAEAEKQLGWVLQNQQDAFVRALAVQRLSSVQAQQKKYDAALATLKTPVDAAFAGALLETQGDVLYAQGKSKEAAEAYRLALDKTPKDAPGRETLEMKAGESK